jgi:hypothetical protein
VSQGCSSGGMLGTPGGGDLGLGGGLQGTLEVVVAALLGGGLLRVLVGGLLRVLVGGLLPMLSLGEGEGEGTGAGAGSAAPDILPQPLMPNVLTQQSACGQDEGAGVGGVARQPACGGQGAARGPAPQLCQAGALPCAL